LTASYHYNSLGQHIKKTVNGQTTVFFYDDQGHLLGEYAANGSLVQEFVWFGNLPIAAIKPNAQRGIDVFYIHADHLGTPRKISRPSDNQVLWTWESEAFGNTPPNENPTGQGSFVFNLRFPGQYYDQETGLHYNYFRDYDAGTGRYVQSDPIGLDGGINTYTYVGGNPVNVVDPEGLISIVIPRPIIIPRPVPIPRPIPYPIDPVMPLPPGTGQICTLLTRILDFCIYTCPDGSLVSAEPAKNGSCKRTISKRKGEEVPPSPGPDRDDPFYC